MHYIACRVSYEVTRIIPSDHPSLPGHFPDRPIVPAVVILDEVIGALAEWRPLEHVVEINSVKFLAPLEPDQPFVIQFCRREADDSCDVVCRVGGHAIVQGRLLVQLRSS